GGGKDGTFYLVDPAQFTLVPGNTSPALLQLFDASHGEGSPTADPNVATHHIHGSPVVYDSPEQGVLVYVWGENDVVRAYRYNSTQPRFPGQPSQKGVPTIPTARGDVYASADVPARNGMPGGILSISANGKTRGTGIVWGSYPPFQNANRQV